MDSISFGSNGNSIEVMRFDANGDIYIKGKLVTNDLEVVKGIKEFLKMSGVLKDSDVNTVS